MSTADYLSLLDWTVRQPRAGKRGATPKQAGAQFERLVDLWFSTRSTINSLQVRQVPNGLS